MSATAVFFVVICRFRARQYQFCALALCLLRPQSEAALRTITPHLVRRHAARKQKARARLQCWHLAECVTQICQTKQKINSRDSLMLLKSAVCGRCVGAFRACQRAKNSLARSERPRPTHRNNARVRALARRQQKQAFIMSTLQRHERRSRRSSNGCSASEINRRLGESQFTPQPPPLFCWRARTRARAHHSSACRRR